LRAICRRCCMPPEKVVGLAVELNLAVVIVTHDLGVARLLANRLLVMKQGQVAPARTHPARRWVHP
jgi:ABC-type phosphonate transport system ATPase subunit